MRVVLLLVITLAAAAGTLRIEPTVDFVDTVPEHAGLGPYRALLEELDGTRFVVLYMPAAPDTDLRSDDGFDALVAMQGDLQTHLAKHHDVTHFLSVHEAMRGAHHLFWTVATSGNPPPDSHSVPDEPLYSTLRDEARDRSDDVLAADGTSTLVLAFLPPAPQAELRDQAAALAADAAAWHTAQKAPGVPTSTPQGSGLLIVSQDTDARTAADLAFWTLVSAGAVALVLTWVLRSALQAAIAATSLAAALLWTFGTIGWLGLPVSFLTVFLAPVVAGIGIDHAIHLLHARRVQKGGAAVRRLGAPMLVATATTVLVLGLMGRVQAPLFAEAAQVAALGVASGLLAAVAIVPLAPAPRRTQQPDRIGAVVARMGAGARRHRLAALIVVLVLVGAAGAAASQIRIESGSSENEFPQDDPNIVLQHTIESEYGAFHRAYLVLQGDIAQPRVLHALDRAAERAQALPLYRDVATVNDLLRGQAATDEGALDILGAGSQGLPDSSQEARYALHRLFEDPFWSTLAPFLVSRDLGLTVVAIQVEPWEDQGQMLALRDGLLALAAEVQDFAGPDVQVAGAGSPVNRAAVVDHVVPDVAWVAGAGTLAVGLVTSLAWIPRRRLEGLRASMVAMGLVAATTIVLLGAVHGLDTFYRATDAVHNASLGHMFLLAFALSVGLGVDDMVHIVHATWRARDRGEPDPLRAAWQEMGRSVTGTTLTTFAAFLPLAGSYFLQSKNLAILVACGVAAAWTLSLLLVPWAVRSPASARKGFPEHQ